MLVDTAPKREGEVAEFTVIRNPRAVFLVVCAGMPLVRAGKDSACTVKLTVGKASPVCLSIAVAETSLPDA